MSDSGGVAEPRVRRECPGIDVQRSQYLCITEMLMPRDDMGRGERGEVMELVTLILSSLDELGEIVQGHKDAITDISKVTAIHDAYLRKNADPQEIKIAVNKVDMAQKLLSAPCQCPKCVAKRKASQ